MAGSAVAFQGEPMPKDKVEQKVRKAFESVVSPRPKRRTKKERELNQHERRTARKIETLVKRTARRRSA